MTTNTCIVALKDSGDIYMAADSAGVDSGHNITVRKDTKVFKKESSTGEFVIGGTTSFRMLQLLRYSLDVPDISEGQSVHEYMCTDFVDSVKKSFEDDDEKGTFLVGVKFKDKEPRLFKIFSNFQVSESYDDYESCGCGGRYAKGSLFHSENELPETRVEMALEAANHFSSGVCKPFNIEKI